MPTCMICQHVNPKGALICIGCGKRLVPLGRTSILREAGIVRPRTGPLNPEDSAPPSEIELEILNTSRRLTFPAGGTILLGRPDLQQGITPDVDLTSDGGLVGGVSRRHAQISFDQGQCFIEDMESSTGTFINRESIEPSVPHPLYSGDEIRVGVVTIRVKLQ